MGVQSVVYTCSCARYVYGIECIDIETYVDGNLGILSNKLDRLFYRVVLDVVSLNDFRLKVVDVADANVDQPVERQLF